MRRKLEMKCLRPKLKLLWFIWIVPAVVFGESGTVEVSPFRDQTPPSVDRLHAQSSAAGQSAPVVDRKTPALPGRQTESSRQTATRFDLTAIARCLKESGNFWHEDTESGAFVLQGSKRDGKNSDYYLVFTKEGAFRLDLSELPPERPIAVRLKAGNFEKVATLPGAEKLGRTGDKNALFFQYDEAKALPIQEKNLASLDWNAEVEMTQILSIVEYYRSVFAEAVELASQRIYKNRSEQLETDLKDSVDRAKKSLDEAAAALERLSQDLAEKKIEQAEYDKQRELLRSEHQFWLDAWGALANRRYHTSANKFTEDEHRIAVTDLESQIRLSRALTGYGACREMLEPAFRFLFPVDEKNGLGEYLKQRTLETGLP